MMGVDGYVYEKKVLSACNNGSLCTQDGSAGKHAVELCYAEDAIANAEDFHRNAKNALQKALENQ